eukprot:10742722-Alexandrium_andersonii.AAC.1
MHLVLHRLLGLGDAVVLLAQGRLDVLLALGELLVGLNLILLPSQPLLVVLLLPLGPLALPLLPLLVRVPARSSGGRRGLFGPLALRLHLARALLVVLLGLHALLLLLVPLTG